MGRHPRVRRTREATRVLETLLQAARKKTVAEWQPVFEADHDVWAEVFRRGTELLHHPQMIHNGMVAEFVDTRGVAMRQPGPLVRIFTARISRAT